MDHLLADLLLGLIEGVTEFLPISSTGHLLIAERWLGARSDLFNIAIQAGAILAVVLIYRQRLWQLLLGWRDAANRDYLLKLGAGFAVSAVLGLIVKKLGFSLPETIGPVAWALVIGGFVMLAAEAVVARRGARGDVITWPVAVLVGVAQVVAGVFPGTSRSAAAIFAALLFGTGNRVVATEFAFLIGIPTMFAATGYELLHVLRNGGAGGEDWSGLAVAFVTSAITAFVVVKWLLGYIQTHKFTVFAWYRIVLGIVLLAWPSVQASTLAPEPAARPASSAGHAGTAATAGAMGASDQANGPSGLARATAADASARASADREYAALKVCVDGARIIQAMAQPGVRADLERSARGDLPEFPDPAWRKKVSEGAAAQLALAERAIRECDPGDPRVSDGSIYELALAAARLGNARAAECYVAAAFPMSRQRWEDPAFRKQYKTEALNLIGRGIAAGDWAMVRQARMVYASMVDHAVSEPWRQPGTILPRELAPGGDRVRFYAFARLGQLGQMGRRSNGEEHWNDDQSTVEFAASLLTREQIAAGDAWARRTFANAFGSRPKAETPFDGICD